MILRLCACVRCLATTTFNNTMVSRRRSTAPRGRDEPRLSRRQSQWTNKREPEKTFTPTFILWCASCILLVLSAAMHFYNKAKTAEVPVLKHDQAQCAEGCWVREMYISRCSCIFCFFESLRLSLRTPLAR